MIAHDITERRKAQEATQASEKWLRQITDNMLDMITQLDLQGRYVYASPSHIPILGYKPEELLGRSIFAFMHPEDKGKVIQGIQGALQTRTPGSMEFRFRHAQGHYLYLESMGNFLHDSKNEITGAIFGTRDVTARKQAEEALKGTLKKLKSANEGIIQALAVTSEARDPFTAGHQRRVADLAQAIAREMPLSQDQIEAISMAGMIHDLGKISIPADILSKPSRLLDLEMKLIRMHSQAGYDILKDVEFPWPIAKIILQHHERLDGSGYPSGLKDQEILPEAKVLMVADVVEAMASHRPYRPAHRMGKVLEEIRTKQGKLYDPQVAEACLRLFKEKRFRFS
jgi:PAS domain S-box-containing protein